MHIFHFFNHYISYIYILLPFWWFMFITSSTPFPHISDNKYFSFLMHFFMCFLDASSRCSSISLCHGLLFRLLFVFLPICFNYFSWTVNVSSLPLSFTNLTTLYDITKFWNQDFEFFSPFSHLRKIWPQLYNHKTENILCSSR